MFPYNPEKVFRYERTLLFLDPKKGQTNPLNKIQNRFCSKD
ncbi:hypothetical protein LEP1GSC125_1003 [Leptospira mayottensis 200901122]|uniref:Uncharacterized protein n=1 Tax=Leptospira mayottensis 200901122 TaxID=1193010 RepID=A0AA87MLL9_9LEPT|nr:hypothetical protein LEP1GSC125_1003 [Leptospira mayottensis 200901122]